MNKKAIAILGGIFLLIVGTLGYLVYQNYAGKKAAPANTIAATQPPAASGGQPADMAPAPVPAPVPVPSTGSLAKLSDEQVLSPVLFFDGSGITYFTSGGQLMQANLAASGNIVQLDRKKDLGIKQKPGISKILWPQVSRNFMAQLNTGTKKTWSFFDNSIGDYFDLPAQVAALDWAPQGDKIYYIWSENGKTTLNVSDPNSKNWKYIADMWEQDDDIKVSPDGKNIVYYETANTASSTNAINLTTPDGKIWRTLIGDGYNLGVLWSPDSQKFIFTKKEQSSGKYQLWYFNLLTGEVKNLGLYTTVDKAVWASDSTVVYVAAPTVGTAGMGQLTQDSLFRINTASLDKKAYAGFSQQVDVEDLLLTKDGTKLIFRNAQDGYLYYLGL